MKAKMILNKTQKQPDDEIYECLNLDRPKSFFSFCWCWFWEKLEV